MISSMLVVEWILLVIACSFCWKPSLSATPASGGRVPWSTLTMHSPLCGSICSGRSCHAYASGSFGRASQLEDVVRFQHLRGPVCDPRRDLRHDRVGFARLEVRDVDLRPVLELRELFREQAGAQVLGCDG